MKITFLTLVVFMVLILFVREKREQYITGALDAYQSRIDYEKGR